MPLLGHSFILMSEIFRFFVELAKRESCLRARRNFYSPCDIIDTRYVLYRAQCCVNWQHDEDLINSSYKYLFMS